jgi:hypothetical protein
MHSLTVVLNICNEHSAVSITNLTSILNHNAEYVNLPDMIDICSSGLRSYETTIVPYVVNIPCANGRKELETKHTMNCDYWGWSNTALSILKEHSPAIYSKSYDHTIYILPDIDKCEFAGLGVIGPCSGRDCRIWITGIYASQLATYVHEIGHTLGIQHASYNGSEYGDLSSAMGSCCFQRCYNAGNTNFLQWTHPKTSFNILPLRYFSKDILLLPNEYFVVDTPYDARFFIQYRYPLSIKYDNEMTANFSKCVNVYQAEHNHPEKTDLLNIMCNANNHWSNSKQHFTITIKNKLNASALINIKSIVHHDNDNNTCSVGAMMVGATM